MKTLTDEMSEVFFAYAHALPCGPVPLPEKRTLRCACVQTGGSPAEENGVPAVTVRFRLLSRDAAGLRAGDLLERAADGTKMCVTRDALPAPASSPLGLYLFEAERRYIPG